MSAASGSRTAADGLRGLSILTNRLGRCRDLDEVITVTLDGLSTLFGFDHSLLMMRDETGDRLFTIASRGYARAGIGSEVAVGVGVIGLVAAQGQPLRVLNLQRMLAYARTAQQSDGGDPERDVPLPGLPKAHSQLAAPAVVMGQVLGVLAVESDQLGAFTEQDELLLGVVAHLVASAIELDRTGGEERADTGSGRAASREPAAGRGSVTVVRFFPVDGSTFIDGDYLIKGLPGRILWRLLRSYVDDGRTEFTNREMRLDPSLELPAFRDNLESRLILLKRRLDEREAPMRIEKTGWGRFHLSVDGEVRLDGAGDAVGP